MEFYLSNDLAKYKYALLFWIITFSHRRETNMHHSPSQPPPPFPPSLVPIFFPTPPYLPQPMQPSPSVYNLPSYRFNFHAALKGH